MRRDKSQRNPKLKHIPHTGEHKRDDGSIDKAMVKAGLPEIVAAIDAGNPEMLDMDQTDPGPNGEYYVIFRMRAK